MMYVSGETGEPSVETTSIIEDIVRQQVIELVRRLKNKCSFLNLLSKSSRQLSSATAPNLHLAAVPNPSLPTTSSSRSGTTKPRSLAYAPSSRGKMSARTLKTPTIKAPTPISQPVVTTVSFPAQLTKLPRRTRRLKSACLGSLPRFTRSKCRNEMTRKTRKRKR